MKKQSTKHRLKNNLGTETNQRQPDVEIESVKLAKVKTGVMAGICCVGDDIIL